MSEDNTEKNKPTLPAIIDDGFAGWDDGVEGNDRPQGAGLIQGTLIKFTNEAQWVNREGDELPKDLELIVVDVLRVVQKWQNQQPAETIILEPNQKFPDIEEMNNNTPREEWVEGPDGKPRGPWQGQHILYLLDPKTMEKFTFPTGTSGGRVSIRLLRDKIMMMRRLRGPNVYPVVTLSDTFFPTRWGGRQRPHFIIKRWVRLGGEGGEVEALPAPKPLPTSKEALDAFAKSADKPAPQTAPQSDLPVMQEPSLKEELNDELPTFEPETAKPETANEPKKAPAPRPTARRDLKNKSQAKTSAARSTTRKRLTNLDAG